MQARPLVSKMSAAALLASLAPLLCVASAQTTCTTSLIPSYPATVASGYQIGLVATGLARPRGIHFDKAGHLLVVEAPRNAETEIFALSLDDGGGICVREASRKTVVRVRGVRQAFPSIHGPAHMRLR
jgi:glucose/arabinose dehydrogenase